MTRVVLTGGIATGKSSFLKTLQSQAPPFGFYDCDAAVHQLFTETEVQTALEKTFGPEVITPKGDVDRTVLRGLVFGDDGKRAALEGILHPRVRAGCEEAFQASVAADPTGFFVADVPLYFETNASYPADLVVVVATTPATQLERLLKRSKLSLEEAESILQSQIPIEQKALRADVLIWNEGPPPRLEEQTTLFLTSVCGEPRRTS